MARLVFSGVLAVAVWLVSFVTVSGQARPPTPGPVRTPVTIFSLPPDYATICPAFLAGYATCYPDIGSASESGEDAHLGYDINPATGNLFLAQPDIHVRSGGGPDLNFVRYYNSLGNGADIGLGPNWTHSFSWSLKLQGKNALITADTGREILFSSNGPGRRPGWTAPNGEFGSLSSVNGGFQYVYKNKFGTAYTFDTNGRLIAIQPADSYSAIRISYVSSGTQILEVESIGQGPAAVLKFSYTGSHISSISDPTGATWAYGYTPPFIPGLCVPRVICPAELKQTETGLLQTVTIPNGSISKNAVHGMILYSYDQQSVGGRTFSPGKGTGELTGYGVITSAGPLQTNPPTPQSNVTEAILGLFSYVNPGPTTSLPMAMVAEAASGFVAGQLLRDIQFTYSASGSQVTTNASLNGGSKKITSTYKDQTDPRLTSITSSAGSGAPGEMQSESWWWNSNLTLAKHYDGNSVQTVFGSYDALGNPTTITEAYGTSQQRITKIAWHPVLSHPLSITTESVTSPGCFNSGKTTCNTHQLIFDYDQPNNGQFPTTFNSQTPLSNYVYQVVETGYTASNLSTVLNSSPEIHRVQIQRDAQHGYRITSIAGPASGNLTTYGYSSSGYPSTVTRSATLTSTTAYDADGRITSVTDPNGNIDAVTYDLAGQVTNRGITSADGTKSTGQTYTRDLAEDIIQRASPDGTISTEFDAALRPWRVSGSGGGSVAWSRVTDFDPFGHPTTVRTFAGTGPDEDFGCTTLGSEQRCIEFTYDNYERLATTHTLDPTDKPCPYECANIYKYDPNGNLVQGPGHAYYLSYKRDPLNRVISVVHANGKKSTMQYDVNNNVVDRDDARDSKNGGSGGNARDIYYTYDDFGRQVKLTSPDIGTWISNFDFAGNLTASEDNSGATLAYTYDGLNRRTAIVNSSTSISNGVKFLYDGNGLVNGGLPLANAQGRLSEIQTNDANGNPIESYYGYDYRGRMTTDTEQRPTGAVLAIGSLMPSQPYRFTTTYNWNPSNGQLPSITYPDGLVVTNKYSSNYGPRPRVSEIDVPFGGSSVPIVSNTVYSADGQIGAFESGSGTSTSITRNKSGELRNLTIAPGPQASSTAPIWQEDLSYNSDPVGQVSDIYFFGPPGNWQPNHYQWHLTYDLIGRLTGWTTEILAY